MQLDTKTPPRLTAISWKINPYPGRTNPQLAHPAPERIRVHTQDLGGARITSYPTPCML
jgi:hypothetical protein